MENIFLHLVNMSITAGWIALAVMILRLFLKKAPKWITVLLWGLVGLRLILPVSIESVLSLIPSAETIPPEIVYAQEPQIHSGIEVFNSAVNPVISESLAPSGELTSINPVQVLLAIATVVWIAGVAGMLVYTLISYLRLRHKVRVSMSIEKNTYICDDINTPFILGIIKPKIYLPSNLTASEQDYVLRHEKAHIKRKDHLIKPLSFLLLSVYWFNPLLWVAYILLCRDIELACDEKVIRDMGIQDRKEYSTALLNCSIPRRMISACPLAFGEVSVKQRIKSVLNYKKPAFWISIVAIILCVALSVGFLTNPVDNNPYGVKVVDSGSDIEGVSVELMKLDLEEDAENNASIEIKWKNKNAETYTCGEEFYIYKYIDGEWVNIRTGDYAFVTIGYMIPAKGTFKHTYGLWNIEIDEVGTYRFASTFLRDKGDTYPTEYTAWVDFEVTKIPDFDENGFSVTSIHSDREGISAKITDLNLSAKKPYIEVMWINDHDYDVTCGEYFYIYKLTKGEWVDCRTKEESFEDIAYVIPAHGTFTHKYSLNDIDMSSMGTYRFEAVFSGNGEKVRIDFEYPVKTKTLATTSSESQPYGITGEILSLTQKENHDGNSISLKSTLSVRWSNSNGDPVYTQKEIFTIYKKVNGEWVDHSASQPYYYSTTKVTIPAVKGYVTIDHPLTGVSYLTSGTYKLETHFYTDYGEDITAFIEFTVGVVSSSANYESFETEDVAHFYCNEAQEVLKPQITLYRRTREFHFTLSGLSSYVPTGKYSTDDNILTLTADDGNKYVFEVTDAETLVFLADESADLPKYRYKQNEDARHPFEDGAVFSLKADDSSVIIEDKDLYDSYIIDEITADIDSDGIEEKITLTPGQTSGIFSFRITASQKGVGEYSTAYTAGPVYNFSFEKDADGKVYLIGTSQTDTSEIHRFDLNTMDKQIIITENGIPYGTENKYYKIEYDSLSRTHTYYIYDTNGKVVSTGNTGFRLPRIEMVNDSLIKYTLQAGTGILTQHGFFYDIENSILSRNFYSIYDQTDELVLCGTDDSVIVQDIFNEDGYYREFKEFSQPLSENTVEKIANAYFANNGTIVVITYLTGENYEQVTESFPIN